MAKFKHTQGISSAVFTKTITVYCPLGKDFYTAELTVDFRPDEWMMDYIDVENFIDKLQGSTNIIEDVVAKIHAHLNEEYQPKYVKVVCNATNAKHFPVIVTKE